MKRRKQFKVLSGTTYSCVLLQKAFGDYYIKVRFKKKINAFLAKKKHTVIQILPIL